MLKLVTASLLLALCSEPQACLGPQSEDYLLLDALPSAALAQDVVARVRVVSRTEQAASVVVVEAIKGVLLQEKIEIKTSGSSCSWLDARSRFFLQQSASGAGSTDNKGTYYIAGNWRSTAPPGGSKTFTGAWQGQKRVH